MPTNPTSDLNAAFEAWYEQYQGRVNDWIAGCTVGDTARIILELPDLLRLLVKLSGDQRLTAEQQVRLRPTAEKVLRGIEYLPTDHSGVPGLISDAVNIAEALEPLLPELDHSALREAWQGDVAVEKAVRYLVARARHF